MYVAHCGYPPFFSQGSRGKKKAKVSVTPNPPRLTSAMIKLWEMTVAYKDPNNRQISSIFMILPTRKELPEYYQIIKKPIDLKKVKVCLWTTSVLWTPPVQWTTSVDTPCTVNNLCRMDSLKSYLCVTSLVDLSIPMHTGAYSEAQVPLP